MLQYICYFVFSKVRLGYGTESDKQVPFLPYPLLPSYEGYDPNHDYRYSDYA